jgi:hypothetical protein
MHVARDKQYDIFLSYSRLDEHKVRTLYDDLVRRRVRPFLDQKSVSPGELFEDRIFADIAASKAYCIALTKNSEASEWVRREYAYARKLFDQNEITLIPLFFDKPIASQEIATHNGLNFTDEQRYFENLQRLLFPGITGRQAIMLSVNPYQSRLDEFHRYLQNRHGINGPIFTDVGRASSAIKDYIASSSPPRIPPRIVVAIYLFARGMDEFSERALNWLFELRARTRNTSNEIVFLLVYSSLALKELENDIRTAVGDEKLLRLTHYFHLPTDCNNDELPSRIDNLWCNIQAELMQSEWTNRSASNATIP